MSDFDKAVIQYLIYFWLPLLLVSGLALLD